MEVKLSYDEPKETLIDEMEKKGRVEHTVGRVLCGPHRDDISILLNGADAALTASQGERASILLALKLTEIEWIESNHGIDPILILDDLGATLDDARRGLLFDLLRERKNQALISTVEKGVHEKVYAAGGRALSRVDEDSFLGFSVARWVPA
jgi:DNA replication and repair protein RecF